MAPSFEQLSCDGQTMLLGRRVFFIKSALDAICLLSDVPERTPRPRPQREPGPSGVGVRARGDASTSRTFAAFGGEPVFVVVVVTMSQKSFFFLPLQM